MAEQTAAARAAERTARGRLRRIDAIGSRAARLGTRLQEVLLARYLANLNANNLQVTAAGTAYPWLNLKTDAFWRAYLQDRGNLLVHYRQGYPPDSLPFDKVQTLMGYPLSPDDWASEIKDDVNSELATAVANQQLFQHSSMTAALGYAERFFTYNGEERSVEDVAEMLFDGADLVLELLRAGLIDENFTLYITQFPGQAISASAMNFIIKAVQPDEMDIEYHFGAADEVDVEDIRAVLDAEEARLFGGQSIYNIELFDYLLAEAPDKLKDPIGRLATAAASDQTFIDAYLTSGTSAGALAKGLSASWPDIFGYLLGQDPDARSVELLDAALGGVQVGVTYTLSSSQRVALRDALPSLSTIRMPQSEERANAIAATLDQMGIHLEELSGVAQPLREQLVARNLYPVTLANLRTIVENDEELPLDRIKTTRQADVYQHVLSHMVDYLAAMEAAPEAPTITSADHFAEVLAEVGEANVDVMEEVARQATADCMITDLDDINAPLWPALAAAHRLALTAQNVAAYIGKHDIDADLANWLSAAAAIEVPAGDSTPLTSLAVSLLNAPALNDDVKLRLVKSLHLEPESIAAADLQKDAHSTAPALVQNGLISDDANAYSNLDDDEWAIKKELIEASDEFPNYITELSLSTNELFGIASSAVPDEVKDALLSNLEALESRLGAEGAAELAKGLPNTVGYRSLTRS
ncbi:hypothetical protein [Gordonia polyisoprenivorans]|uniref:hypothetical protein n=1 Tax=Gordonia polyisoprenivorans TaxID=84595 RepID=UPI001054919D|nr:hypothetical protein [Gordonia polyisoprenivorans]